jgi:hypothetical protein
MMEPRKRAPLMGISMGFGGLAMAGFTYSLFERGFNMWAKAGIVALTAMMTSLFVGFLVAWLTRPKRKPFHK